MEKLKLLWENKKWIFKSLLLGLLALLVVLVLPHSCQDKSKLNPKQEVINPNGGKVIEKQETPNKNDSESENDIYVPPEGSITIQPKDKSKSLDDVVEIKRQWYGLTLEPGIQVGLINGSFGLDAKLAYMNRLGLITGITVDQLTTRTISPAMGFSYRLDGISKGWFKNTEGFAEWKPLSRIPMDIGLRINF